MTDQYSFDQWFDLSGQVGVVTGAGGILCSEMARALAAHGVKVAILDLRIDAAQKVADQIKKDGGEAMAVECNVLDKQSLQSACDVIVKEWNRVDILVNGAGGNSKNATTSPELSFFDLPAEAVKFVLDLNILGTILPSQVFAKQMCSQQSGCIINISSMNALRPLTKIPGYSAAKAAISNFTQWLAVHLAQTYSCNIRVNAIAPGFFLTDQNRFLLTDQKTGDLTDRGQTIINHTPMGRFGCPEDLLSTLIWLAGPGAKFLTGLVVPVDGGFSAFSGV